MRYLAEIQKQSKGFMGGFETKLKLLAYQASDRSWNIEPGNKSIPIEDTGNLGDGALVMVNVSSNNQIQGTLEPASTRIIGILQSFSRLLEKSKSQEEEIETWKESLTIQSEQLSAREIEMETRLEQLERMEEEFNQFEAQRQEISAAREEVEKLKIESDRQSQQLAREREQIQQEQQRLEQNLKEGKVLDESQAAEIQSLIDSLSSELNLTDSLGEHLHSCLHSLDRQQEFLIQRWRKLEQSQKTIAENRQQYFQSQSSLDRSQQELESLEVSIKKAQQQLQQQQHSFENKQQSIAFLTEQDKSLEQIQESLELAGIESSGTALEQKIDVKALENMPLAELEKIVAHLQRDFEKIAQFVQDQEEELNWQCQAVAELEQKIKEASEFDRLALDHELAEEKEAKKMLDETLVGQRRSLKERHERFLQHSRILKRRQGVFDLEAELQTIDLEPIKNKVQQHRENILEQKNSLKLETAAIEQNISTLKSSLEEKLKQKETVNADIKVRLDRLEKQNIAITKMQAELDFYQENLQPLQDGINKIREQLENIGSYVLKKDSNKQNPNQTLTEIDRMIKDLVSI